MKKNLGESIGRWLDAVGETVAVGVTGSAGAVLTGIATANGAPTTPGGWVLLGLGGLAAVSGVARAAVLSLRVTGRERSLAKHRRDLSDGFGLHSPTSWTLLEQLQRRVLGAGPTFRMSLFTPVRGGGFRLVARYSEHKDYREAGNRETYPLNEGLVARVWRDGKTAHRWKLPANRQSWEQVMQSDFNMSMDATRKLRMQSRSYVAVLLRLSGDGAGHEVGVLIAESTSGAGIEPRHVDLFTDEDVVRILALRCQDVETAQRLLDDTA